MSFTPAAPAETFAAAFDSAVALHKSGNAQEAATRYERLRASVPDDPQLLYLLGGAYVQLGRPNDAIAPIERSLALRPGFTPALDLLGSAWVAAGEPQRALPYFRESADTAAAPSAAVERLATTLLSCNLPAEAFEHFRRCLESDPNSTSARVGAAKALIDLGRASEAEAMLRDCLKIDPTHVKARIALGMILGQHERFAEAGEQFREALETAPTRADAQYWLGVSLQKQGRSEEAIAAYSKARTLNPDDETVAIAMAETLVDLQRLEEAQAILSALKCADSSSHALTARGRLAERRGDLDLSISLHDRAITADPQNEAAYINRGNARRFAGDYEGALEDYDAGIAIKPSAVAAIANRGLSLLTLGRLADAWPHYRSRIRAQGNVADHTEGKPWDGGSLAGKRVLVWAEYGLGDQILFASMLPEILSEARHCTVLCASRLVTLFQRSFPNATIAALGSLIAHDHDVHVALTDLAQRFRPDMTSFSAHRGYLRADESQVAAIRARYGVQRKLVGISWRSASGPTGAFKGIPLEGWHELLSVPGICFVSLQYGDVSADLTALREGTGINVLNDPAIDASGDFDPFAAQVAAMDLVISISNTTVHVAGALGKPVWILVPEGPGAHWYWFRNRVDNPWYPAARLFRQARPRDWSAPLHSAKAALQQWARS